MAWTLRATFRGLVDLVTDKSSGSEVFWIFLPRVADPTKLALHSKFKADVAVHDPRLYFPWTGASKSPCFLPLGGWAYASLSGCELKFEGDVAQGCKPIRAQLPGKEPSNASQTSNLNWLADIDYILNAAPWNSPRLRNELFTYPYQPAQPGHPILDTRLQLHSGTIQTSKLWRSSSNKYVYVHAAAGPWNSTKKRVMTRYLSVEIAVKSGPLVVILEPLGGGPGRREIPLGPPTTGGVVEILVDNLCLEKKDCSGGSKDFLAHYVLRDGSETFDTWPEIRYSLQPTDDAQCSPGDNQRP